MKNLLVLVVCSIVLFVSSCKKDDNTTVYKAMLSGSNEVPTNSSGASGSATLTLNEDTNVFTLDVTYSGMAATAMHIHEGAVGVSGGVVFPITTIVSPINFVSVALTVDQVSSLENGQYYLNIHSAEFPGGEIRGNFTKQ